jgi:hypothetical protein
MNFWGSKDVELMEAWVEDLTRVGYVPPSILPEWRCGGNSGSYNQTLVETKYNWMPTTVGDVGDFHCIGITAPHYLWQSVTNIWDNHFAYQWPARMDLMIRYIVKYFRNNY